MLVRELEEKSIVAEGVKVCDDSQVCEIYKLLSTEIVATMWGINEIQEARCYNEGEFFLNYSFVNGAHFIIDPGGNGGHVSKINMQEGIKLVNTIDGTIARVLKGHKGYVTSLAFDPKSEYLASLDLVGTVIFWEFQSGNTIHVLKVIAPNNGSDVLVLNILAWSPDGEMLAVPGLQNDVKLMALKKAYANIILSISKEAAARVMASEKKSVRYQHDLKAAKEEGERMLLRLKQMTDSQITEAKTSSLNQQKKIDELEAQLQEAEDIVRDLKDE